MSCDEASHVFRKTQSTKADEARSSQFLTDVSAPNQITLPCSVSVKRADHIKLSAQRMPGCDTLDSRGLHGRRTAADADLILRITYYAAKKGFWTYLPTNARRLRTHLIDKLADAGLATFNITVDAVDIEPAFPKHSICNGRSV